jgi:hypothetical protein
MAGTIARATAIDLLDHLLKGTSMGQPANVYVALSTTDPGNDGATITEPAAGAYARTVCNSWNAAAYSAGKVSATNITVVTFPEATAGWGDISHFALFDAITGGVCLAVGEVMDAFGGTPTPRTVITGDIPRFKAGTLRAALNLAYGP